VEFRLKRLFAVLSLLFVSCTHLVPQPDPLAHFIETEISQPPFTNALWGIRVEEADGSVLYDRNGSTLVMPASNRKIFMAAFAAECLGLDSRLRTELWIDGEIRAGTLEGNVVLKGGGDPSLGGRYESDRDLRMMPFVDALRARRIGRITGSVVGDVSLFSRETIPGSWKTDNLGAAYAAPVDALAFNENVAGVRVRGSCLTPSVQADPHFPRTSSNVSCAERNSFVVVSGDENEIFVDGVATNDIDHRAIIAIREPGLYAAQALTDLLLRQGIGVEGEPRISIEPQIWNERIAVIESPPVYELLATALKPSQNLYSEMILRVAAGGSSPVDYAAAFARERLFLLSDVGLDPAQFRFEDGSGLSVENMVTPAAIVRMYRYLWEPPRRGVFFDLLARPGEVGTLRRRLEGLETRMRGKTGTIDTVTALSGYVLRSGGTPRFFAVIVNHHLSTAAAAQAVIDRIVQRIASD
jgi:serine-type D-Ala-D-Ala carboxypeptidase/endopeptidase (penicillin-binding protein 4)